MDLYWRFILLIATITAASPNTASTKSDYYFLTHTFSNLSCDPYANKQSSSLALECSVQGPRITHTSFIKIVWYRTLENASTTQNLNNLYTSQSEQVQIEEQVIAVSTSEIAIVRSVLTVANLNLNNVSGEYWCTIEEEQLKPLLSENALVQSLTLHPSNVYQGLEACLEGAIHTAVANNRASPSTSSSSFSSTISTPLATISPLSTSTSTIQKTSIENSWTTRGIALTSSSSSTKALSFLEMTSNIAFTVTIGVLFFLVHVLLVILGCFCCRGKQKRSKKEKESLPLHHSDTSLTSSSSIPEVHCISPTTSPLVPPIILTTSSPPPCSPPNDLESLSKSQNCSPPKMKKLPPLPAHFTLPSRFMNKAVVPTPEINAGQLQDEREKTNIQARHRRQEEKTESEALCSTDTQAKKPCERTGGKFAETIQGQCLVFPNNNNNPATCINNRGVHRLPDASLASFQFEDNITNKYKSLNKEMMEATPIYENPHCTRSNDWYKLVKDAVEHAKLQLPNDVGNAARESMDGEYVLPNEVVWAVPASLSKGLAAREQPEYITIS